MLFLEILYHIFLYSPRVFFCFLPADNKVISILQLPDQSPSPMSNGTSFTKSHILPYTRFKSCLPFSSCLSYIYYR